MDRVQGKVVIVTGAASGIGKQDALLLAGEGARVVITDLNEDAGRAARARDWRRRDVRPSRHLERGRLEGRDRRRRTIDSAGSTASSTTPASWSMGSIEDATLEQWQKIHRINADGYFLGCKYAVAAMKSAGGGSIVNMSSIAAEGLPFAVSYSGSKASVAALTHSVAVHCKSCGYRIRCNSIHPDGVLTPMVLPLLGNPDPGTVSYDADPTSRFCDPKDVANLVLFLISDESRFISGSQLRITNAH